MHFHIITILSSFLFIKHQISFKGVSKHFCTVKSYLTLIGLSNQWTTKRGGRGLCLVCQPCVSPHFTSEVSHYHDHTSWITCSACLHLGQGINAWNHIQNICKRPPISLRKFWWPGRGHMCCALVLTRLCICGCFFLAVMSWWTYCRCKQDCWSQGFDRNKCVWWRWLQTEN